MSKSEYVEMTATSIDCSACGASISFGTEKVVVCDFCETESHLLPPIKLQKSANLDISGEQLDKFSNMLKICETSMQAGTYSEAYDYCNKLLEIDPENGEIYANKAICTLYNSSAGNIYEGAKDISTFIQTALRYSPESETVTETAENIASNLYWWSAYKAAIYMIEDVGDVVSASDLKQLLTYIKVWDTAFDIHPDTEYLKNAVTIMSGHATTTPFDFKALPWVNDDHEKITKSSKVRDVYIKKIQKIEPDYEPPSLNKVGQFWAMVGVAFVVMVFLAFLGL